MFDYAQDWDLLADALQGEEGLPFPDNLGEKWLLTPEVMGTEVFQRALAATYCADLSPHHALADARALRSGFVSWRLATLPHS
ncbi:hypothetical protein [Chromobacterium violaceum]|uniref:hypothetical protein n=1 Tax=Chromobacterium violaceum TaxID=536 RepID=UPI003DAA47E4